jgi:hypothetical protein
MVHCATGTFRDIRRFKLGDDLVDGRCIAVERRRYVLVAE